jgi:hypothetical protein
MNVQNEEGWSLTGGSERRSKIGWYIAIGLFVAWNILLFILAVVALAKANESHDGGKSASYTYQPITRTFKVSSGHVIGSETFVSLNSDGTVRDGAGTSCYMNSGPELSINAGATDLQIISFDPDTGIVSLEPNEFVVAAYTHDKKGYVNVGQISLDKSTLSSWGAAVPINGLEKVEAIVPLSTAPGVAKSFAVAGMGHLFIGEVVTGATGYTVKFSKGADYIALDTVDSKAQMARLTYNTFALSYYLIAKSGGAHVMNVTVGTVTFDNTGKYESMKYFTPHQYESDRAYSTVYRLGATVFGLAYPSVSVNEVNVTTVDALMSRKIMVGEGGLSLGPEASLQGVKPNYYMTSIGLPLTTDSPGEKGVIVFIDAANNNALTAAVIAPENNGGSLTPLNSLRFGDVKAFASDVAGNDIWQRQNNKIVPFIGVAHISDQDIAVAYSDYGNNGRVSTFRFSVGRDTQNIENVATPFVVSGSNPNESLDYWWISVASLGVHSKKGWIVLQYLEVPGTTGTHHVNQTIVDVAPPPFGITSPKAKITNAGKEIDVIISGAYKFNNKEDLTPGRFYYVNTRGELKERQGSYASTDYVKISSNEFLSLRSRVGVAVSKDELLLINELSEEVDY